MSYNLSTEKGASDDGITYTDLIDRIDEKVAKEVCFALALTGAFSRQSW
jgi:recombinational DNA repair protein RecR